MSNQRYSTTDSALLLIDHQVGTLGWVKSLPVEEVKRNALMLAEVAKKVNIPVVLTTSMEENAQGPLLDELKALFPKEYEARIRRHGVVNAMDDENFSAAVKALGRKNIIIAGVTNDVCAVFPSLSLIEQGYNVYVAADAGGSPSKIGDDLALWRMQKNGVVTLGTNQLIAELASNWASGDGKQIMEVVAKNLKN